MDLMMLSPKETARKIRFSKVIVLNPPDPPGYVANRDSMGGFGQLFPVGAPTMPPLDYPYLVSYLAEKGVPIEVLESQGLCLTQEDVVQRVLDSARQDSSGPLLVVARVSAPALDWELSVCSAIKRALPSLIIAVYGPVVPHVLIRLQQESWLDYLIQGEPDETVHELATGISEANILGLSYRSNNAWVESHPRQFMKKLDDLPFPKWELLPYQRYTLPKSSTTAAVPFLPMVTSRGCPFGCHYCPYPVSQGLPWRYRSPENVVNEIEHLVKDLGIQYILFRDPMFSMKEGRVKEICAEILRRNLRLKWKCETRPDCLDEETVKAMAAAGCDGINFGVESVEVEIQSGVGRKPIPKEEIIEMTAICRKYGIKTFCFFIIGLPGDTRETILNTIEFAIQLRANWVQFTAATPFIGTKLREWAVSQGLITATEYAYINSHEATVGNENLSKREVERLHHLAKFFERYLINRFGILKDVNRTGAFYSVARTAADVVTDGIARMLFTLGRLGLQRARVASGGYGK